MNIFIREYKANIKSLIIWAASILGFLIMALYEGLIFAGEEAVNDMMETLPEGFLAVFAVDNFDLSTFDGYYGLMVIYIAIILAVYCVMRSCSIVTSEERDKTAEFSLTMPIKRWQLISAKLVVVFINAIILNLLTVAVTLAMSQLAEIAPEIQFVKYVLLSAIAMFFIQIVFMGIGFMLGCVFKNHKRSGAISVGILLATYFFSVISGLHDSLEFLKYLTPFQFFDFREIFNTLELEPTYLLISIAIFILTVSIGFVGYQRRDLHI